MDFEFGKVLNFSFIESFKQKGVAKYLAAFFVMIFVMYLGINYMTYVISPSLIDGNPSLNSLLYFFFGIMFIVVVFGLISSAISYILIGKALKAKGRARKNLTAESWIRFIGLQIGVMLAAVFSAYKPKLLLFPVAAIISGILGAVLLEVFVSSNLFAALLGVLLVALAFLLAFAYMVIIAYNAYRLVLASAIFVEGKGIMDSLRLSWETTRGNVLNIFILIMIVGVTATVVSGVVSFPLNIYEGATISAAGSAAESFKYLADPVATILALPNMIIQTLMFLVQVFVVVGLYDLLDKPSAPEKKHFAFAKTTKKRPVLKAKRK